MLRQKQVLDADDASRLLEDQTRYASDDLRRNTYHHFGTDRLALGFCTKVLPSLSRSPETAHAFSPHLGEVSRAK